MSRLGPGIIAADDSTNPAALTDATTVWPTNQGGLGQDTSATTGIPYWTAGTVSFTSYARNEFRLIKSGDNLTLEAVNGNLVDINGVLYPVTSLPTLAATGLTPDTNYYIYLYDNSGTATLEASTTSYTVDSAGRANKTGDTTRRLMGLARPGTGPVWVDSAQHRLVLSRDNRKPLLATVANASERSTASASSVALNADEFVGVLTWADSLFLADISGRVYNTTGGASSNSFIHIATDVAFQTAKASANNDMGQVSLAYTAPLSEGYHAVELYGSVDAGTGYWFCRLSVIVL